MPFLHVCHEKPTCSFTLAGKKHIIYQQLQLEHCPTQDFHVLTFGFAAAAVAIRNLVFVKSMGSMGRMVYITYMNGLFLWHIEM